MRLTRCASCGAQTVWLKTNLERNIMVDADCFGMDEAEIADTEPPVFDHKEHRAHFSTCPHADQHRRARR